MSEHLIEIEHLRQYFPAGGFGKHKNLSGQWRMFPSI